MTDLRTLLVLCMVNTKSSKFVKCAENHIFPLHGICRTFLLRQLIRCHNFYLTAIGKCCLTANPHETLWCIFQTFQRELLAGCRCCYHLIRSYTGSALCDFSGWISPLQTKQAQAGSFDCAQTSWNSTLEWWHAGVVAFASQFVQNFTLVARCLNDCFITVLFGSVVAYTEVARGKLPVYDFNC